MSPSAQARNDQDGGKRGHNQQWDHYRSAGPSDRNNAAAAIHSLDAQPSCHFDRYVHFWIAGCHGADSCVNQGRLFS